MVRSPTKNSYSPSSTQKVSSSRWWTWGGGPPPGKERSSARANAPSVSSPTTLRVPRSPATQRALPSPGATCLARSLVSIAFSYPRVSPFVAAPRLSSAPASHNTTFVVCLVYIVTISRGLRRYSVERLSSHDLESLISRLSETIYAYCDVGGFKTRLVSALLGRSSPAMEDCVSTVSQQTLESIGLTRREIEILHLVAQGKANKEIAAALYISPLTVRT